MARIIRLKADQGEKKKAQNNKLRTAKKEEKKSDEIMESASAAKIVSVILAHAAEGCASDIHIEPLPDKSRVRYRIDGLLETALSFSKNINNSIVAEIKTLSNLQLDENRLPQNGRFMSVINGAETDFRVSTLPLARGEEKIVLRILKTGKDAPALENLGFTENHLEIINRNIKKTSGLVLVTGPVGSGKSATIFSIINKLNQEGINISTLEDPIEYAIKGVNQTQVMPEIGLTFASGLRTILRQDPDVIMVGEIRDQETAQLAAHASLTGRLVLSALHADNCSGAVSRLIYISAEPSTVAMAVDLVLAQRLVRKICLFCKEKISPSREIADGVREEFKKIHPEIISEALPGFDMNDFKLYRGKGCPRCAGRGYSGRTAIAELLEMNDALRSIIIDKKRRLRPDDISASQKFLTLKQDGVIKALLGITTVEEISRVLND